MTTLPAVLVVSSKWPDHDHSGVSLTAAKHVEILAKNGYSVHVVGAGNKTPSGLRCVSARAIAVRGTGALYSPARVDHLALRQALLEANPAFVLVEAWQTGLSEATIDLCHELGIPVAVVSHGVSVSPFSQHWIDWMRSLSWKVYRHRVLPRSIRRLDALTALDLTSQSPRFLDRDLARKAGITVLELVNSAVNSASRFYDLDLREDYIVSVGYFSRIKNQLELIEMLPSLPSNLSLHLVGPREGRYYHRCLALVQRLGLQRRVEFLQDNECDVGEKIARARVYVSSSITEALPVTLLEAMAAGTPFVSYDVGAVGTLSSGGLVVQRGDFVGAISSLLDGGEIWRRLSGGGRAVFNGRYSSEEVERQILALARFMLAIR